VARARKAPPAPSVPAIPKTLVEHKVAFVVVGGAAVVHHGNLRTTEKVGIVPEPSEENLRRLWGALVEMRAAEPLALSDLRPEELPVSSISRPCSTSATGISRPRTAGSTSSST
jgi:hypothetical protein